MACTAGEAFSQGKTIEMIAYLCGPSDREL